MKAHFSILSNHILRGHKEAICGIYSPQGEKGRLLITVSKDGCLRGWDVYERKKISKVILKRDIPEEIEENVDKEEKSAKKIKAFDAMSIIESCIFNENVVFCGYSDGSIYTYNMKSGNIVYKYQGHEDKISGMEWIDYNAFVTASYDETIVFWDTLVNIF